MARVAQLIDAGFRSVQDGIPFFYDFRISMICWWTRLSVCKSVFLAVLHIYKGANASFVHFFSGFVCEFLFLLLGNPLAGWP